MSLVSLLMCLHRCVMLCPVGSVGEGMPQTFCMIMLLHDSMPDTALGWEEQVMRYIYKYIYLITFPCGLTFDRLYIPLSWSPGTCTDCSLGWASVCCCRHIYLFYL